MKKKKKKAEVPKKLLPDEMLRLKEVRQWALFHTVALNCNEDGDLGYEDREKEKTLLADGFKFARKHIGFEGGFILYDRDAMHKDEAIGIVKLLKEQYAI